LASASFAADSFAARFLNRFRLTISPAMLVSIMRRPQEKSDSVAQKSIQ